MAKNRHTYYGISPYDFPLLDFCLVDPGSIQESPQVMPKHARNFWEPRHVMQGVGVLYDIRNPFPKLLPGEILVV